MMWEKDMPHRLKDAWMVVGLVHHYGGMGMKFQLWRMVAGIAVSFYLLLAVVLAAGQSGSYSRSDFDREISKEHAAIQQELAKVDTRMTEVERREKELEALQVEHRLTMIETMVQTSHSLLLGMAAAIGLLLIETTIRGFFGLRKAINPS
jgi:uncharacterized protein YlxW (UPF0749 family)